MIRRFSRLLRLASVFFMVGLLSLSGGLNIFTLEIGANVPAANAAAGQQEIARPKLKFRESDGQFLVVGENQKVAGIFIQNGPGNPTCFNAKIGTIASGAAIKSRMTFDAAGNIYVVWMQNSGTGAILNQYQSWLAVLDPNCNQVPGSPFNLSDLLNAQYGSPASGGYPDITYSFAENRLYLAMQGTASGTKQVFAFSAVASTSGWGGVGRWDRYWPLSVANAESYPRIAVDNAGRGHIIFKSFNNSNGWVRAVDLTGGANGTWNLYGGPGKDISNNPGNAISDGTNEIGIANDGNTYATYLTPGNGPSSLGLNRFDPTTNSWGTGRDNVIGTNSGDYGSLKSSSMAVGHIQGVYLGVGTTLSAPNGSSALTYNSSDKGQTFPVNQRRSFGPGSGDTVGDVQEGITLAEGNSTVGVFWHVVDNVGNQPKQNRFTTYPSYDNPPVTIMDTPVNGSTVTIPAGQPTTSVSLSWHNKPGTGTGAAITYYLEYYDSTAPGWQPLTTTTATTFSANFAGTRSISFRVRGIEAGGTVAEPVHPGADTTISLVYAHFTKVDAILDANGYYAPSGTADPNGVSSGLVYYPLPKPIRMLDTRPGQTAFNTPNTKIAAGTTATYQMAGINYTAVGVQIPPEAVAIIGTVSVVGPAGGGYLTTYPTGSTKPLSASMSYVPGTVLSNAATMTLGTAGQNAGKLDVFSLQTTDLVIDVSGYYAPAGTADPNNVSSGLVYFPLPKPIRMLDTRPGQPAFNTPNTKIAAGGTVSYPMAGINYTAVGVQIPAAAIAVAGNTTAIFPVGGGYLTTYPSGATKPLSASVSYGYNSILDTSVNLTLGTGGQNAGQLSIYSLQTTDLIIDVTGYYAPAGTTDPNGFSSGLLYFPLPTPTRLIDTRPGQTAFNMPGQPLSSNTSTNFKVAGINYVAVNIQIPAAAQAIDSTITVVVPPFSNGEGFITGYPGPADPTTNAKPLVTILYYYPGNVLSNNSIQTVGGSGDDTLNLFAMAF